MFRRRRPLARAAMIGGGAYVLGKRSGQGNAGDGQGNAADGDQDDQAVAAAPSGGLSDSAVGQLEQLGDLKERGVLTVDEFDEQKKKILEAS